MATLLLVLVVVLVIAGLVYGVFSLISGDDPGLVPAEPDGRARPLPNDRSLHESDLKDVRFDLALRGYRMAQVDRVLRRTAYDLGYKDEMIAVLEAEVAALREGRHADAEVLRKAREDAASPDGPADRSDPMDAVDELDDEPVSDFEPAEPEAAEDGRADQPTEDEEPEPREGSLRRRNSAPETTDAAENAALSPVAASGSEPPLEVADRPAHA